MTATPDDAYFARVTGRETADIVIVGGGIVGTSIAYHLARRGAGADVILLERDTLGSGTTGSAGGGVRAQFSTEINIRFSLEALAFWRRADEELGSPIDFRETGFLILARKPETADLIRRNVHLQNSLGVPSRFLERSEIGSLAPWLFTEDLAGAAYCAIDGRAGPNEATQAFARNARAGGVRVREHVAVTGIDVAGRRVMGVDTSAGRIDARDVVIAAGPWAGLVGELAGVTIPVTPYRRTTYVSERFDDLPMRIPITIDMDVGWSCAREGQAIKISGRRDARAGFERHVEFAGLEWSAEIAVHRVPALAGARFGKRASAGLYDVSPDNHAILGTVPGIDGLYVACGFSGHGFQHAPPTGRLIAELLLDGRTTGIDIAPLSIARFARGELLHETMQQHVRAAD